MQKAKKGSIELLFVDASHFVMGCDYLGYIYGKVRKFVRTFSGRKRYNVLGALNYVSKKLITVTNDAYITATEVCELIRKVSSEYVGKPIYLVLDNARYQKCESVQALAAELCVSLVYIPPYSPNLNLIERLWKHVKGRLRTKHYNDFGEFKNKIDSITECTGTSDKEIIDSLIGDKVQLFDTKVFDNTITFSIPATAPIVKTTEAKRKKAA